MSIEDQLKNMATRRIMDKEPDESIVKMRAGKHLIPVKLWKEQKGKIKRIYFQFKYNVDLMAEIKSMEGSKYLGYEEVNPRKVWSVLDTQRNQFQIDYLCGKNPYARYDAPLIEVEFTRPLMTHQKLMSQAALTRRCVVLSAEPGTGKTLSAIEVMERVDPASMIWVGSRSALSGVALEFRKWKSRVVPPLYTYDGLKKLVENWSPGDRAPQMIIFDEAHALKTPTSQRSQSAMHLANAVREEWGEDGYIIAMTGTPAPKNPLDWWNLCEIVRPGYLKEGTIDKFRNRLALIHQKENTITGGIYPALVTWLDDERKCATCGLFRDDPVHTDICATHAWKKSENEVSILYERLKGLVTVLFKRDCLKELPEKIFRTITCKPTPSILRAAEIISANSPRAITALTLLRGLSDGFKYEQEEVGVQTCPLCKGAKTIDARIAPVVPESGFDLESDTFSEDSIFPEMFVGTVEGEELGFVSCTYCGGSGTVKKYARKTTQFPSPKEDVLVDLLEEHDEVGRFVIYAGFTGSIEKVIGIVSRHGWDYIKFDGKGLQTSLGLTLKFEDCLELFQSDDPRKIAFVGQPSAGGEGITLTKSPSIFYYSNDFNGKSKLQSSERIHRPGMDLNKGATIIEVVHLPTDQLIIDNLMQKKRLQDLSMGALQNALKSEGERIL